MKSAENRRADVVIAGGGMVGLTLGLALARAGLETIVVDGFDPGLVLDAKFDGRVSSFAPASRRVLMALGLWPHVEDVAQPVLDIIVGDGSVKGGASAALLHFDHREMGDQPLAHMIENRHFRMALQRELGQAPLLTLIAPQRVTAATLGRSSMEVVLGDGQRLGAGLCIAADGRESPLREAMGIKTTGWAYAQTGIVATIAHERPHEGVAHELFLPSGPFAILPMTGHRSSIVWTERSDQAPAFVGLNDEDFAREVRQRFGDQWGAIKVEGPRWFYPLSMQLAHSYIAPRFALAGDAGHSVHPIAGQGLNLGLRDAAALAEVVIDAKRLGLDIGSEAVLARYQAWRRFDNALFTASMDALNRLFSNDIVPLAMVRRLGLDVVDAIVPLKRFFMRQAGGEGGEVPRLMRGEET
ncbi:MAG: FAD-dependent monooxygenase [Alphaproteobacteria bacterium]|nr:FAD-dependent monooxygenase [Alphaproteobacteria bacterium]